MAFVFRRWRVLLVLNVLAVAGCVTFWAKCNSGVKKAAVPLDDTPGGHGGDGGGGGGGGGDGDDGRKQQQQQQQPRGSSSSSNGNGNGTAGGSGVAHEVLLRRLGSLEDVVYRQLNGLSKSLGLIEGFGGRGQGGLAASLAPAEESEAKQLRDRYGYNAYLSDKVSLDRSIPDYRPSKCRKASYPRELPQISLIFIFVNEALSVILRSVHSAVNHTPAHLLKEIILVDDYSDDEQLKGPLEEYVNKRYPGLVKFVRNQKREGLIRARIEGWKAASGEVRTKPEARGTDPGAHRGLEGGQRRGHRLLRRPRGVHAVLVSSRPPGEFTPSWAEPVLARIKEDGRRVILPSIDNIRHDTLELERYENSAHGFNWELWCMYINPPRQWWDEGDTSAPIRTPAMIGCSFVVDRVYFGELGLLDPGMDVYGGENIELGIRVWLCGGSMEVLPCSRVAHIARVKKPYHSNIAFHARRNSLRVAEVWMDDYKSNVYLAWNIPMEVRAEPGVLWSCAPFAYSIYNNTKSISIITTQ
ncbi:hypothetical protein CRUP_033828 [Coryphaenoides rupestris]|nr:hypothetical protein CRUP_033828 [Coryphaenoides rupestris]